MQKRAKQKMKPAERFFLAWGGTAGFVAGAALVALVMRWLGGWPPSEAYLRRFIKE